MAIVGGAERAVELTDPAFHLDGAQVTFAGRDVFAPVAAHLCNGVDLAELGPLVDTALLMPGMVALPREEDDGIHAEVLWVDRFGNCQLNIGPDELTAGVDVWGLTIDGERRVARLARTFADLGPGSIGLVVDSQGMYAAGPRPALGGRRAAAGGRRRRRRRRRSRTTTRPSPTSVTTPIELRRAGSLRVVRPATTLAIGLLLAAILLAGVIALLRI